MARHGGHDGRDPRPPRRARKESSGREALTAAAAVTDRREVALVSRSTGPSSLTYSGEAEFSTVRVGELPTGAIVRLRDGTFGIVMTSKGQSPGVAVDLWDEPAALLHPDEVVELVESHSSPAALVKMAPAPMLVR